MFVWLQLLSPTFVEATYFFFTSAADLDKNLNLLFSHTGNWEFRKPPLYSRTDLMMQPGRDRQHAALSHSWQHGRQHGEQHEGIVGFRQQGAQAARDLLIHW